LTENFRLSLKLQFKFPYSVPSLVAIFYKMFLC